MRRLEVPDGGESPVMWRRMAGSTGNGEAREKGDC